MPVVTDTELFCEMVKHGQIGCVVVAHHDAWVAIVDTTSRERLRVARRKAVHRTTVDLPVGRFRGVLRVPALVREIRRRQMVDRVAPALGLVSHSWPKPIDVFAATFERQVTERVIEGTVLQHQHDDVLDPSKTAVGGDRHGLPL